MKKKVAIVLCTFNRKEKTINCISSVRKSLATYEELQYLFYVCDDKSTDGTREWLMNKPDIILVDSPGNLSWNKSMHRAMKRAKEDEPDFFLMINDDVVFNENMIQIMFKCYESIRGACGIVGSTQALNEEDITYGGRTIDNEFVLPTEKMGKCLWANWNCFLVGKDVTDLIGLIDPKYEHGCGDYDYSYKMYKKNIPIYVASEFVGRCDTNSIIGTYQDMSLGLKERMKRLFSPKGVPIYSFFRFNLKVYGWSRLIKYVYIYCSIVWYTLIGKESKSK